MEVDRGNNQTSAFAGIGGDITDPLIVEVLDANGNPEPNAIIQSDFGTTPFAPTPEPATFGMIAVVALVVLGSAKRRTNLLRS